MLLLGDHGNNNTADHYELAYGYGGVGAEEGGDFSLLPKGCSRQTTPDPSRFIKQGQTDKHFPNEPIQRNLHDDDNDHYLKRSARLTRAPRNTGRYNSDSSSNHNKEEDPSNPWIHPEKHVRMPENESENNCGYSEQQNVHVDNNSDVIRGRRMRGQLIGKEQMNQPGRVSLLSSFFTTTKNNQQSQNHHHQNEGQQPNNSAGGGGGLQKNNLFGNNDKEMTSGYDNDGHFDDDGNIYDDDGDADYIPPPSQLSSSSAYNTTTSSTYHPTSSTKKKKKKSRMKLNSPMVKKELLFGSNQTDTSSMASLLKSFPNKHSFSGGGTSYSSSSYLSSSSAVKAHKFSSYFLTEMAAFWEDADNAGDHNDNTDNVSSSPTLDLDSSTHHNTRVEFVSFANNHSHTADNTDKKDETNDEMGQKLKKVKHDDDDGIHTNTPNNAVIVTPDTRDFNNISDHAKLQHQLQHGDPSKISKLQHESPNPPIFLALHPDLDEKRFQQHNVLTLDFATVSTRS